MNILLTLVVPLILAAVGICAVFGKADIFSALTRGAAEEELFYGTDEERNN